MYIKKFSLVLLFFLSSATSLVIFEECHPKDKWVGDWKGSHVDIIFWLPESISYTTSSPTQTIFTLILEFRGSSIPQEYDNIRVKGTEAEIQRVRGGKEETKIISFPEALGHGWIEFNFTVQSSFDLWYKSEKIVSLEANKVVRSIIIRSSNITVNCYRSEFVWLVTASESAVLPIAMEEQDQHLSFFSNSETKPIIALANTNEVIQLGWDNSTLVDITKFTTEYQQPLLASVQYWITISCSNSSSITCSIFVGKEKQLMKVFHLKAMPATVTVSSGNSGEFYVFLQRPQPPLPTLPSTHSQEENISESGSTGLIIVVVLLSVALLCAIGVVVGMYLQKKIKYTETKRKAKRLEEIEATLLEVVKESMESQLLIDKTSNNSHQTYQEPRMWEAVRENDSRLVEFLLRKGLNPMNPEERKPTTPFLEAHILCHKEILHIMSQHSERCGAIYINELIKPVLSELELRMKTVFDVAEVGMYEGQSGVKLLLETHSLPPTIKDRQGCSLVHYMANAFFIDGRPAWDAKDIEFFLKMQECYVNAIDHWGHTPLHKLSQRNRKNLGSTVFWNNKEQTIEKVWVEMARIFLSHGCDPSIPNHDGVFPHELARENGHYELATLLEKTFNEMSNIDHEEATKKFEEYALAARQGDTAKMITLLKENVPLLPIWAHADPLVEAIRYNQRDAVFLLLSAGTPLNNRSIGAQTPLEAAHNTVDLPGLFPALMRKVYTDRLEAEQEKIPCANSQFDALLKGIKEFIKEITEHGSDAKWKFTQVNMPEKSKEARELLVQAAELGLSLVCQCLSQEDVNLFPLKKEEKPFHKAVQHKKVDTQFALYRDLKMSPFTSPSSNLENLDKKLWEDIWASQIKTLEETCANQYNDSFLLGDKIIVNLYIEDLKKLSRTFVKPNNGEPLGKPPDLLLYIVAKRGLDLIYYVLFSNCKSLNVNTIVDQELNSKSLDVNTIVDQESNFKSLDVNTIVDQESKCTALHIASMHGQLNLIEFLVYKGADLNLKTIGGFEAIHLAAVRGHKETTTYIAEYMKSNGLDVNTKCNLGLTAFELLNKYEEAWKNSEFLLMTHKDALFVKNEKGDADQAYELLKRRGKLLPIESPNDLLSCSDKTFYPKNDMQDILEIAMKEMKLICQTLENSPFEGQLLCFDKCRLEKKLLWMDNVHFFVELSKYQCLENNQTVTFENVAGDETCNVMVKSKSDPDLFIKTNFIEAFSKTMKTSIANYVPSSPDISIVPPFLRTTYKGVRIYLTVYRQNVFNQLNVHLVPLIPAKYPEGSRKDVLPIECIDISQDHVHLRLANLNGGWVYRPYLAEIQMFKKLNENQRMVWKSCRLIMKLLDDCEWAPSNKHFDKPWHTFSVGVPCFTVRALKTLFQTELTDQNVSWEENDLYGRVLSTYQRAASKDVDGNWVPKESIASLIIPQYHYAMGKSSVCGILKYLEELQETEKLERIRQTCNWKYKNIF